MNQLRRELLDTLDSCRKKIGKFRSMDKDIVVSEHAILRFLERVEKLDIEKIKESILPPITKDLISKMSKANGSYPSMTHQLVLRDNIIVTVKEL